MKLMNICASFLLGSVFLMANGGLVNVPYGMPTCTGPACGEMRCAGIKDPEQYKKCVAGVLN